MAEINENSADESNIITKKSSRMTESILDDYIIPKRLIYANSLIKSLKDKKYTWENEGKKVYIKNLI